MVGRRPRGAGRVEIEGRPLTGALFETLINLLREIG